MSLSFVTVDSKYCDFLRKADPCIPYTANQKEKRPFVGVLLSINDKEYYAPLTSPKPKHLSMKNSVDFVKIDQGKLGAINFNNMIPIHSDCLKKVDLSILPNDSKSDKDYKMLLGDQLDWCNKNKDFIINKAVKLHAIISQDKAHDSLKKRCCNFPVVEKQYVEYRKISQLSKLPQIEDKQNSAIAAPILNTEKAAPILNTEKRSLSDILKSATEQIKESKLDINPLPTATKDNER